MKQVNVTYIDTATYTVTVAVDDWAESPRQWDNLGTMLCSHRNYTLGDEQLEADVYTGWQEIEQMLYKERNACIVLPLGLYDHSGITMYIGNSHDRWDGGQVGFIYVSKDTVRKEYGVKRITAKLLADIEQVLRAEVETYDHYLRGDVYSYAIHDSTGTEIDLCSGFYGDTDIKQAIAEALPDAVPENVTITGRYSDGTSYDPYFDYADCIKSLNERS